MIHIVTENKSDQNVDRKLSIHHVPEWKTRKFIQKLGSQGLYNEVVLGEDFRNSGN